MRFEDGGNEKRYQITEVCLFWITYLFAHTHARKFIHTAILTQPQTMHTISMEYPPPSSLLLISPSLRDILRKQQIDNLNEIEKLKAELERNTLSHSSAQQTHARVAALEEEAAAANSVWTPSHSLPLFPSHVLVSLSLSLSPFQKYQASFSECTVLSAKVASLTKAVEELERSRGAAVSECLFQNEQNKQLKADVSPPLPTQSSLLSLIPSISPLSSLSLSLSHYSI